MGDEEGRDNHARVSEINEGLKARGIETWFDSQGDMKGNTLQAMTKGIDECDLVVVFVSRAYVYKCNKEDNDNCKFEFEYAFNQKQVSRMLVVAMERDCADPKTWIGPVGAALGTQLYIDCKDINEC